MKIKPSKARITLYYLITIVILGSLVFLCLMNSFLKWPWEAYQYIVIAFFLVIVTIGYIIAIYKYYYLLDNNDLAVVKFNKEYRYPYNEIVFMDENKYKPGKTLTIYTTKRGYIYLTADHNDVLFNELKKRCKNLISDPNLFYQKFPNAK